MTPIQPGTGRQTSPAQCQTAATPARATQIILFLFALAGTQLANPTSAFAGLILSVGDLTLPAGDTAFVDVHIRSDGSDVLSAYSFGFRIAPVGLPDTHLEFTDPQAAPQLADPAYVFSGNSVAELFGELGTVSQTFAPGDTLDGGDTVLVGSIILDGADRLLARLQVTAATGLPGNPGDQFSIEFLTDSVFLGGQERLNINFDESILTGTVTISEASPVPEPASLTLFCLGGVGLAAAGRRGRRHTMRRRRLTGAEPDPEAPAVTIDSQTAAIQRPVA